MSRHKGRTITKLVERYFPHHVDMMVPEFGLGAHQAASKFVVQSLLGILWFPLRSARFFIGLGGTHRTRLRRTYRWPTSSDLSVMADG